MVRLAIGEFMDCRSFFGGYELRNYPSSADVQMCLMTWGCEMYGPERSKNADQVWRLWRIV